MLYFKPFLLIAVLFVQGCGAGDGTPVTAQGANASMKTALAEAERFRITTSRLHWLEPRTERLGSVLPVRTDVTDAQQVDAVAALAGRLTLTPRAEPDALPAAAEWIQVQSSPAPGFSFTLYPNEGGRSLVLVGDDAPEFEARTPDDALRIALLQAAGAGQPVSDRDSVAAARPDRQPDRFPHDQFAAATALRLVGPDADGPAAEVTDGAVLAQIAALVPVDAAVKPARPAVIAGPPPISVRIAGGSGSEEEEEGDGPPWFHVTPTTLLFLDRSGGFDILYSLPLPDAALHDRLRALRPAAPLAAGSPTATRPAP